MIATTTKHVAWAALVALLAAGALVITMTATADAATSWRTIGTDTAWAATGGSTGGNGQIIRNNRHPFALHPFRLRMSSDAGARVLVELNCTRNGVTRWASPVFWRADKGIRLLELTQPFRHRPDSCDVKITFGSNSRPYHPSTARLSLQQRVAA